MRLLARRGAVTIVGDADQGFYGFRYTQAVNLKRMIKGKILLDLSQLQTLTLPFSFITRFSGHLGCIAGGELGCIAGGELPL